jgi:hypothetical protein
MNADLMLHAIFDLNCNVPTDGAAGSRSAPSANTNDGAVAFVTTHWSVVLAAQGDLR